MSLRGSAFLALWNDIEPHRRAEYDVWHTLEHVPERTGIAGFVRGRRYVARERGQQRYFTLYELGGLEALESADYAEVVEHPTEWSRTMRPSFRNVLRRPYATAVSLGLGVAGGIATLRFSTPDFSQAGEAETARAALQPLLETVAITAVHLGRATSSAPPPSMAGLGWDHATEDTAQHVLLVEGPERYEVEAALPWLKKMLRRRLGAVGDISVAAFDLAFIVERADLPSPTARRQAARPDLHRRWQMGATPRP